MNDVTSMLYVSLVRQFETLLFYVVTSRIEALVSHHKFLNACVKKVYCLLFFWTHLAQSFRKCRFLVTIQCTVFRDTFGKNSTRSVMVKRLFSRIFTSICSTRSGATTLRWPLRLSSCTLSRPLSNCHTIVGPYCHSSLLLHRPHTPVCEYWLVGYSWPVEIGWLHGSHSRQDFQCALLSFTNSNLLLLLATASKTQHNPSGMFAK